MPQGTLEETMLPFNHSFSLSFCLCFFLSLSIAIEDLDEGVVDSVLEVEVAEADINVDGNHKEAQVGKWEVDVGSVGDLVHVALAGGNVNDEQDGAGEFDWACGFIGGGW